MCMETWILELANCFDKQQRKQTWQSKNLQQNQCRKLKTCLAKSILLKIKAKKSRFPKVERSKSLKVVAKAFEEPNMHKHDAKNA